MPSRPTAKWPFDASVVTTQAWAAAGSTGGLLPAAATVVLRSRNNQPNWNGTGNAEPFTCVRCVSAGNGMMPGPVGCGEKGNTSATFVFSSSSKNTMLSWPSGYHGGWTPAVAGQVKGPWLTFESRHTSNDVPALNGPPFRKRVAKVVASGSRLSAAVHASERPADAEPPALGRHAVGWPP